MLDETLVIWGGEFGRTPMSQGGSGRDHHIKGFSFMVAGGGIKKGLAYGATDELGYAAVENPVSVHDFHATMLRLLGVDAAKLAVKYQGLDVRLTGPEGGRWWKTSSRNASLRLALWRTSRRLVLRRRGAKGRRRPVSP